jgi:YjbE family integral membrane protein
VPDLGFISAVLSIVVIDLVLSGDNAVVIGMAAGRLSPANRKRAIVIGGAGAVGLRMIFTIAAALLLDVPLLQAVGGLLLLWIAYRLVRPQDHTVHINESSSLAQAIRTIILADVVMSLDNILAVGGAAHGSLGLLLFGLALSIPILLLGSELIARLIGRLPILNYVGAVVLIMTAIRMVLEDEIVDDLHDASLWEHIALTAVVSTAIILAARWLYRGSKKSMEQRGKTAADPSASSGA